MKLALLAALLGFAGAADDFDREHVHPSMGVGGAGRRNTVCVTGASGYVASVLVAQLLKADYAVVGTVRRVEKYKDDPLFATSALFAADLLKPESFAEPFALCDTVMHTASPFWINFDPKLIPTAVDGTLNVLKAATTAGVMRVVVTSSCAAVTPQDPAAVLPKAGEGEAFSEADWNLDSTEAKGPYRLSKRLAEQAVWKYAKSAKSRMLGQRYAVVNPSFVLGPPVLKRASGESVGFMKKLLEGAFAAGAGASAFGAVDVRDLALAHIRAMERLQPADDGHRTADGRKSMDAADAKGAADGKRFVLSSASSYSALDIAAELPEAMRSRFAFPTKYTTTPPAHRNAYTSARAAVLLGVKLRPVAETVTDMATWMLDQGMVDLELAAQRKAAAAKEL